MYNYRKRVQAALIEQVTPITDQICIHTYTYTNIGRARGVQSALIEQVTPITDQICILVHIHIPIQL